MPQLCKTLRQFNFSGYDHVNGELEKLAPMKDIERYMTKFLHGLSKWVREQTKKSHFNADGTHSKMNMEPVNILSFARSRGAQQTTNSSENINTWLVIPE